MKLLIILLLISCGKIRTSSEVKIDGETYSYVLVKFQFLDQIKELCSEVYPSYEYTNKKIRKKLIAECTLDKLNIFNLDEFQDFKEDVCPEAVTIEEINICEVLTGIK